MVTPERVAHNSLVLTADDDFPLPFQTVIILFYLIENPIIPISTLFYSSPYPTCCRLVITDYKYITDTIIIIITMILYSVHIIYMSFIVYLNHVYTYCSWCWTHQRVCIRLSVSGVDYTAVSYTEITHSNTADVLELQPLTLRNYVNSLEPYNPEVHGWRDTTPPVMRSVKHSERATQLVTAIRMSGLQDIEILGVPDGHS